MFMLRISAADPSRSVTQRSWAVRYEKKVKSNGIDDEIGSAVRADVVRRVLEVELASARHVDVTRGLVRAGV